MRTLICLTLFLLPTSLVRADDAPDFAGEVLPILQAKCARCHVGDDPKGGLSLASRDDLLRGGDSGPAAVAGKSAESLLIELVSGVDETRVMPPQGGHLSDAQIVTLKRWIDTGLTWPAGLSVRSAKTVDIAPRMPAIPPADPAWDFRNKIDLLLQDYYRANRINPRQTVSDRVFARRAALDLIGLLPSPADVAELERDSRPDKRARFVRRLLDDNAAYADHWLTFWNDALRNAYRGTGFIDDGRRQITPWLYEALYHNKPYRRFVHELISPVDGSEGFTRGIVWRGVVNASQRREMQAAQTVSQVFLGNNLKCASCHDSFISQWKLEDAYALANVFADEPLEIHRCNKPLGRKAETRFLYTQLGDIDPTLPRAERLARLADLVTSDRNGRLQRTVANRYWALLMGRGLVEPVDEMDNLPWNAELLDFLGADLAAHGDDLKHLLFQICTSQAYQLPSTGAAPPTESEFTFRGPVTKRMTAEQFADAIATLTHHWPAASDAMWTKDGRGQGGQLAARQAVIGQNAPEPQQRTTTAQMIWSHADAHRADPGGSVFFRKTFTLDAVPPAVTATVACDNEFILFVNGRRAAAGADWSRPTVTNITRFLRPGANTIAIRGINYPDPSTKKGLQHKGANPAGLFCEVVGTSGSDTVFTLGTDETWLASDKPLKNWNQPAADDGEPSGWKHAAVLGPADLPPWNIASRLTPPLPQPATIRASLTIADPLLRALGRPNREQVVTRRDSQATTLQALELTNGETLDTLLNHGGEYWLSQIPDDPARLTTEIFQTAFNRDPTPEEREIAVDLLGSAPTMESVADLLWTVTMQAEFQLIR